MQGEVLLGEVVARGRAHPAYPSVMSSAYSVTRGAMEGQGVVAPVLCTTGCEELNPVTLLALRVLKSLRAHI